MAAAVAAVVALASGACGHGAPGGFPAALQQRPSTTATAAASSSTTTTPATAVPNSDAQGSPIPGPSTSEPGGDEARVTVTLAKGQVTPSVSQVQARRLQFVISNDDNAVRTFDVATGGGTTIVSSGPIAVGDVGSLSVEVVPGRYTLVASGGGGPRATATFIVAAP